MTTDARIGHRTLFQTGDTDSPPNFTTLGQVIDATPPGPTRDSIDGSHTQSPDAYREFFAGMVDGGECVVTMNAVTSGADLQTLQAELVLPSGQATKPRRVVFPDGSYCEFAAFLTGAEIENPLDDKAILTATFKVSGRPTFYQS